MPTNESNITVTPIEHASLVLQRAEATLYIDPVGDMSLYAALPRPNIILVTHEHHDHFSVPTLEALMDKGAILVTNPSVADKLPETLKTNLVVMKNGDTHTVGPLTITAVPAYNTRGEALQYHPKGRDNGYVLESMGKRVYIAGDTEGTPEMRALTNIDIAFVPMNMPYTMPVKDAAQAVLAFAPKQVYPYHYRDSNVEEFKSLVQAGNPGIEVILAKWY